jgi:acetaldehyde dehydrogenase (acetylating)
MAGLRIPEGTRVLVARLQGVGRDFPLSIEKLSPILAFYVEKNWRAACDRCIELLNYGGLGHTMAIHSKNEEIIREFGLRKPVFRIVVNSQSALGAVGYTTELFPSMTLGCGSIGGNITSDNISPLHLINIKRLAYGRDGWRPSSDTRARETSSPERIAVTRQDVSSVVDQLLSQRGFSAPQSTSPSATSSEPKSSAAKSGTTTPAAMTFVCEDDVRQALRKGEKIYVTPKSIITPAARDLGTDKDVLVFVS